VEVEVEVSYQVLEEVVVVVVNIVGVQKLCLSSHTRLLLVLAVLKIIPEKQTAHFLEQVLL
jgi:hypothetical protein